MSTRPMSVRFVKVNGRWNAEIYADPDTCVSWQLVGSMKNVRQIIRHQLTPQGIPFTIKKG